MYKEEKGTNHYQSPITSKIVANPILLLASDSTRVSRVSVSSNNNSPATSPRLIKTSTKEDGSVSERSSRQKSPSTSKSAPSERSSHILEKKKEKKESEESTTPSPRREPSLSQSTPKKSRTTPVSARRSKVTLITSEEKVFFVSIFIFIVSIETRRK